MTSPITRGSGMYRDANPHSYKGETKHGLPAQQVNPSDICEICIEINMEREFDNE